MRADLQPTLRGTSINLQPLAEDDFTALYAAASDPAIWAQHPDSNRHQRTTFRDNYFVGALSSGGALTVRDNRSGHVIGASRYYDWNPAELELAIGYTFLTRDQWGTGTNDELKTLMLDHAFTFTRVVWFHIGAGNIRSQRAVEKLGAVLSHREEARLNGGSFTQLFYRLDTDARRGLPAR